MLKLCYTGVQIPFTVYNSGSRVAGLWDTVQKTFTPISITLDKSEAVIAPSGTTTITATTVPANGLVTWATSDEDVATVSGGVVTGVATGSCVIIATYKSVSASCAITVTGT